MSQIIKRISFQCWNPFTKQSNYISLVIHFESQEDFEDAVERQFEEDRSRLQDIINLKYKNCILDSDDENNQLIFEVFESDNLKVDLNY